jgi:ribosomal protein L29
MAKMAGLGWSKTAAPKLSKEELNARIQEKAKELWEKRGRVQNQDLEIWLEAERLVKGGK